jgi:hypothetical protein
VKNAKILYSNIGMIGIIESRLNLKLYCLNMFTVENWHFSHQDAVRERHLLRKRHILCIQYWSSTIWIVDTIMNVPTFLLNIVTWKWISCDITLRWDRQGYGIGKRIMVSQAGQWLLGMFTSYAYASKYTWTNVNLKCISRIKWSQIFKELPTE